MQSSFVEEEIDKAPWGELDSESEEESEESEGEGEGEGDETGLVTPAEGCVFVAVFNWCIHNRILGERRGEGGTLKIFLEGKFRDLVVIFRYLSTAIEIRRKNYDI